jgi:hypothetical protein
MQALELDMPVPELYAPAWHKPEHWETLDMPIPVLYFPAGQPWHSVMS